MVMSAGAKKKPLNLLSLKSEPDKVGQTPRRPLRPARKNGKSMRTYLEFEKPIAELESRIEDLERAVIEGRTTATKAAEEILRAFNVE